MLVEKENKMNNSRESMTNEIVSYIIFGVLTTLVNIVSYVALDYMGVPYMISNMLAFIISTIFAFITNKIYVFESKSWNKDILIKEGITFFGARAITFIVDMLLMFILIEVVHMNKLITKCIVNILVIIVNYLLSKLVVFKNNSK